MKLSISLSLSAILFILILSSCKKDNINEAATAETPNGTFNDVPVVLWDYFQRFEMEAQERGIDISLNAENISAEISEIDDDGVAGTCTYGTFHPGHIVVDATFWSQASDLLKEMIVFHELGHCALHQGHREGTHPNGTCTSIMRSGLENCRDNYRPATREAYLDELFSEVE